MAAAVVSWLLFLLFAVAVFAGGFRVAGPVITFLLLALAFLAVVFFTRKWLAAPAEKRAAPERILSGLQEKRRSGPDA